MDKIDDGFDWYGPDAATFGDRVAGAREQAGMTQPELARRLGVKIATLRAWEEDRSEPRANKLSMLSGLLNVSLPWLLSGQGMGLDGPAEAEGELTKDINDVLLAMREIKTDLQENADKLARLEKRLRVMLREQSA